MQKTLTYEVLTVEKSQKDADVKLTLQPAGVPLGPYTVVVLKRTAYFGIGAPREGELVTFGKTVH